MKTPPAAEPSTPFQRFFDGILEAMPCAVSVKSASDLTYLFVNKAARDLSIPGAGAIGKTDQDLFPARKARRIQADDQRVLASGSAGPVIEEELETSRGLRSFCTQKIPMAGIEGMPDVLLTVSDDVTAEAQLVATTEMWEQVFDHSGRGMIIGRPEGTTLELMNPSFALLFGSTLERLAGRPLLDIFDPSVHESVIAMLDIVRTGGHHRFETLCRRTDGTTFPAVVEGTSAKDAEGHVHFRVIHIQDVSLLKSEERALRQDRDEAERANAAKSRFVADLSHELRTPLNVILGFGQVMQLEDLTPTQAESVGHILEAGRHLLAVIDEALDMSRIDSGVALTLQPVPVAAVVAGVLALMQPLADTAGIRMVNESERSSLWALADQHRLQQVLLNLVTNAIHYNVPGGEVRVHIARHARGVNISVIDSGIGIPPGTSHRLFVPFDRLGREGSDVEGTGLGLSLSKALAEAMGGTIIAAQNTGPGMTFTVTLEACRPSSGTADTPKDLSGVAEERAQVLLIEDSVASIPLIEAIHRLRPGIRVLTAIQAGIGLRLARHHQPDLIIVDAYLPDLTGEETVHRLSKDPRTRDIPVILATALARSRRGAESRNGPGGYLSKPIQTPELLTAIDAILGGDADGVAGDEVQGGARGT